jgi:chloramphenicol O-acetyltransferase type A
LNPDEERRVDLVYITTFPWAKFSQVSHAASIDKYDAIPRLIWGKFEEINGKKMMPLSIEAHHGLADGRHVGMLIQNLQATLNQL